MIGIREATREFAGTRTFNWVIPATIPGDGSGIQDLTFSPEKRGFTGSRMRRQVRVG